MSDAPGLILALDAERTQHFEGRHEQLFDRRDGSIGRSDECDWVLGAEGISRLHAVVRYLNGLYFIEDRSTNGMLLNGSPLRKGEPAALKQGDRLQIDTFEVSVRFNDEEEASRTEPESAAARSEDAPDMSLLLQPARGGETEGLIPGATASAAGVSLDPLALFGEPSSYRDELAESPRGDWNHTPAAADRFQLPRPQAESVEGPVLPEDWDATGYRPAMQAGPVSRAVSMPVVNAADADMPFSPFAAAAEASEALSTVPPSPTPTLAPGQPQPTPGTQQPVAAPLQSAPATFAPPASPVVQPPAAEAPASERDVMLEIAVDAMMDVLRARAELKNSFRLPATLIQRSENNPLKFAPTAKEAVKRLLAPPDGGFLSGSAALDDAAADIRNHQMAMLAGVRSAFQSMLAHFDPARFERLGEGSARLLPFRNRSLHWERYKEEFDSITSHPDECFRRLFGDEFARAYEAQLGSLKTGRT